MRKDNATKTVQGKIDRIREEMGNPSDLRAFPVEKEGLAHFLYFTSLVDEQTLASVLAYYDRTQLPVSEISTDGGKISFLPGPEEAAGFLLDGNLLLVNEAEGYTGYEIQGWLKREPKEPETERLTRGPREGFTETIGDNVGMIRRWIRDPNLRVEELRVGRRTRTRVNVMYLSGVAPPGLVKEVRRRLEAIDIDGVLEAGYLEQLITDRRASFFPLLQATERSDRAAAALLEGRVAILVDKSPSTLVVPVTINELYQTPEDYYFSFWVGSLLRLVRLLGNNLAVAFPGLYIALVVYHPELLPNELAVAISGSRISIPTPLIAELFIMEIAVEIFREGGLRLPGSIGQTLGVVAGVVLGLTAVQAGFVSPATLVVVAVTAIASFTGPNYEVGLSWRILKLLMTIAASLFGLFGLTMAGMMILAHAADLKSFGVSYLAPWAPLEWEELSDGPVRRPFWGRWQRLKTYRPQDKLRSGGTKREDDEFD
jgi:hypothetical protein